jgi:His/Glu/Gln/Arg/opine family amino acid ABC transporter permease subunit
LALTVFVFAAMMILGMPLAVLLALARHYGPRWMRLAAGTCIDLVRAVPLITILFTAWLFFSLLFPEWLTGGKLFRAVLGFSLFFACYEAEVLRGGLQAIGRGQEEAAAALGLRFWQRQRAVILPQGIVSRSALVSEKSSVLGRKLSLNFLAEIACLIRVRKAPPGECEDGIKLYRGDLLAEHESKAPIAQNT